MTKTISNLCTGCSACKNICPVDAIDITYNDKGFYTAFINEDKCIKCGKCEKICPANNYKTDINIIPKSYAITANDSIRFESSSGGFFSVLAEYVLDKNGYVCGAAWNKNREVEHIIISRKEDLKLLRKSKYVQSKLNNCFKDIKQLLDSNHYVLFTGTPCQNAGLLAYLGKKYEKLITLDTLCHGAPSPRIWQEYLDENFNKIGIQEIDFRYKKGGWSNGCAIGAYNTNHAYIKADDTKNEIGVYYEAFLKHLISLDSCMDCKYKYISRPADFTCGDFWSYKKYDKSLNDDKGLSIVLLNNPKAESIFNELKASFTECKEINLNQKWTDIEISNKSRAKSVRNVFFEKYKNGQSLTKLLNAATGKHYDVGLLTMFNGINYGSALVAFAVNRILENLGLTVLNIHKCRSKYYDFDEAHKPYMFATKNYFLSEEFDMVDDHRKLNDICENFVVGSDTVWWWKDVVNTGCYYWLDFVESHKNKISFCTSFGHDIPAIPANQIEKIKYLYKRFNHLSCREESGSLILKNYFDCESETLIDPTFILDKSEFDKLVSLSSVQENNYIFAYILDLDDEKEAILLQFAKLLNSKLILIPSMYHNYKSDKTSNEHKNVNIEDFLSLIKNANLVITDSFHGTCFSVIYEKKFISILNKDRGACRYNIFNKMELGENIINDYRDLLSFDINKNINFDRAHSVIQEGRTKALTWLRNAINNNSGVTTELDSMFDYLSSENQAQIAANKKIEKQLRQTQEMLEQHQQMLKKLDIINRSKGAKWKFLKYRLLVNVVFGKTRERYYRKKMFYKNILSNMKKLGVR